MTEDPKRISGQSVHRVNIRYKIGYEESVDKLTRAEAESFRDAQLMNPEVATAAYLDPDAITKAKEETNV